MPVRKKRKALSDVVNSNAPMSVTEVAHEEIVSVTHMIVAKAKIAITRCWITVESEYLAQCVSFVFRHINLCVYG